MRDAARARSVFALAIGTGVILCCLKTSANAEFAGSHLYPNTASIAATMEWPAGNARPIVAAISSAPARALSGFQPVPPDELKMISEPQAKGAPAIILFRQVDRDDNGSTSHENNYLRIKVLTEEGRKYADVEIPFNRGGEEVVGIHARTIRPDGSIANFDGKIYDKTLAKGKGVKYQAKTFTLPDVQVGSVLEYFYTFDFKENSLFDSHWVLNDELFTKHATFFLKPYSGQDSSWKLTWRWNTLPPGTEEPKQDLQRVVHLDASNIPAFHSEDYMPPESELKSRIDFIYSQESFEADANKYWKRAGKKMNGHLESFVDKRKAMEQAVGGIVAQNDTAEVKLQKIYSRVQQIRNTSYEMQKTEQEQTRDKEKFSTNVEELWKRGYGNGRDLTWLYLALVRAAGFEAYGVWTAPRSSYFFTPQVLDSSRLMANVVLVKLNGKDFYADPGAAFTPYGLLPWVETAVTGLRMDKDGGTWVQTPVPAVAASQILRKADLKLSDTGDLEGKLSVTFTGLEAMRRRVDQRNQDVAARKKSLEDEVKDWVPSAIEAELSNTPDWNSATPTLVVEFKLKVPAWSSAAGKRVLLPIGLFGAGEKHLFEHAGRVHPLYFEYPAGKVDDVTIELPAGWKVGSLAKEQNYDQRVAVYRLGTTYEKGSLHLTRTLQLNMLLLDARYYPALRNFFYQVRSGDDEQVVLQPGTAAASN